MLTSAFMLAISIGIRVFDGVPMLTSAFMLAICIGIRMFNGVPMLTSAFMLAISIGIECLMEFRCRLQHSSLLFASGLKKMMDSDACHSITTCHKHRD